MSTDLDRRLCQALCNHPRRHNDRYTAKARHDLLETLFRSLAHDRPEYLRTLFPSGFPPSYKLQDAQGVELSSEYSAAAKGHPCGHIFQGGEASYHCMTCADDDTCVLCARCFDSSDHDGHQVHISPSPGNSGCCDCGDEEAWKVPVNCAIHTAPEEASKDGPSSSSLPQDFQESVRTTISRSLDYFCDVISCSPENLRVPKMVETIKHDESYSRLGDKYSGSQAEQDPDPEYCLVLWNDEKHTVPEMEAQIARACRERLRFGSLKASEANLIGRTVIRHSRNINELIKQAKVIEQIKLTVTIRSSRDTFREQMCGTIVEWLSDIAGCAVGDDTSILRRVICEEMLQQWRIGSEAFNAKVGRNVIDTHGLEPPRDMRQHDLRRFESGWRRIRRGLEAGAFDDEDDAEEVVDIDELEGAEDDVEEDEDEEDEDQDPDDASFERGPTELPDEMQIEAGAQGHHGQTEEEADAMDTDADGDFIDMSDYVQIDGTFSPPQLPQTQPQQMDTLVAPLHGERELLSARATRNFLNVPKTPKQPSRSPQAILPGHWTILPPEYSVHSTAVPDYEDLSRNIRLDSMILFDLRLWKQTRIELRDLYISTVVNIPKFKRILGLRFSGLYTTLSQLYLVADREPDHSIMNLSLQMLTTPSITKEVIERGNFLTNLMAILYTFLTTRQVGFPKDVDDNATLALETASVANRRLIHFFTDLRWYLSSTYVQEKVRNDKQYLLQWLDLAKLSQGICPNVRAVGEHVEYETDAWMNASVLTREINRLCRQFAEAFRESDQNGVAEENHITEAIFHTASVTMTNSIGLERKRFEHSEIKGLARFKIIPPFSFDPPGTFYRIIDFVVEKGPMSFHHALHYTLSWLLEVGNASSNAIDSLMEAANQTIRGLGDTRLKNTFVNTDDVLLALFDYPLRVCAWLAQMKAGMWVRNGLSLRHQMHQYKSVSYRDMGHQRDLVLLQTAFVTCDPSRLLASMIDRYGIGDWMVGNESVSMDCDEGQTLDLVEDFTFLLIHLLSDRDALRPKGDAVDAQRMSIRKDIIHILCFKPLTFSDLTARLYERLPDQQQFQDELESLTTYRAPEGLHDSGTFELRTEFLAELDPYNSHFSKNQRDEAETLYKDWMAKKTNKPAEDIVLEPVLRSIQSGAYQSLSRVTSTPLFLQIIHSSLTYAQRPNILESPTMPTTRLEAFLQVVLQLALIATIEDVHEDDDNPHPLSSSFIQNALTLRPRKTPTEQTTIVSLLHGLSNMDQYSTCRSKIKHILRLFVRKRQVEFHNATAGLEFPFGRLDTASPANLDTELEAKKKQALDRKARVMAQFQKQQQNFMDQQGMIDWGNEDMIEAGEDAPALPEAKVWRFPSGVCIHCREETNDSQLYGTFAMTTESNTLRTTDLDDPDFVREACCTPASLDQSFESLRPFGISGANRENVRRLTQGGHELIVERQGLSRGWPHHQTTKAIVSTSCGHIMHFACFEIYCASVRRRHAHQIARNHPERSLQNEFVCPLCKAMGNAFIPILWKNIEHSYPGSLAPDQGLETFLADIFPSNFRHAEEIGDFDRTFLQYYPATLKSLSTGYLAEVVKTWSGSKSDADFIERPPFKEIVTVLLKLSKTLAIQQRNLDDGAHLTSGEFWLRRLSSTIASTITASEIAQRGQVSEYGHNVLSSIPQLTISHLHVLSSALETLNAFNVCGEILGPALGEFRPSKSDLAMKLFPQAQTTGTIHGSVVAKRQLLLLSDPFTVLAESSVLLGPILGMGFHHLLQLCFTAEILHVILAYMLRPTGLRKLAHGTSESSHSAQPTTRDATNVIGALTDTVRWVAQILFQSEDTQSTYSFWDQSELKVLAGVISAHATTFLRKAMILSHVSHRIDFTFMPLHEADAPEITRLSQVLRLPNVTNILRGLSEFSPATSVKKLASSWLRVCGQALKFRTQTTPIQLLHPAPLELIGLPKYFDVLMEQSHRRKCPTTGKELTDPALCLFCGEIFCAQAYCCMEGRERGGCNLHVEKCSYPIGMFLFIRKCQILLLHVARAPKNDMEHEVAAGSSASASLARRDHSAKWFSNGSFFPAPYLTRHGETDSGLRSKAQLILNQKRYDKLLRDAWLMTSPSSTIWNAIARKLEGEVNAGGWETL